MPRLPVLATLLLAFSAQPVHAAHHLMKVDEVMLALEGDSSIQFVELEDPGELFPDGTYRLEIYDATAQSLGNVSLSVAPQTTRFLVATPQAAAAFQVVGDAELTVALPVNGQACFARTIGTRFHCLAWGCIETLVVPAASVGASPPDGSSLQRQPGAAYQLSTPTPGAVNTAGTDAEPCPEPDQLALSLVAMAALFARRTHCNRNSGRL